MSQRLFVGGLNRHFPCAKGQRSFFFDERHQINRKMTAFFESYDLLLTPTVAVTAFPKSGPPPTSIAGTEVNPAAYLPFTPPFNLTGHPAASVPAGLANNGLPVGLQIVAARHDDIRVLRASAAFEAARPFAWPEDRK